jgi:thiol-disulfide isomerase/thioredoxin
MSVFYDPAHPEARFPAHRTPVAVLGWTAPDGHPVERAPMNLADGVFRAATVVPPGTSYLYVYFVTPDDWDPGAMLSAMVHDEEGNPAPGALARASDRENYLDMFRHERSLHPGNFAAFRAKWWNASYVLQADELKRMVRDDLEEVARERGEGTPSSLWAESYGHLLLGDEPRGRAKLVEMSRRFPGSPLLYRAFMDYLVQQYAQGFEGDGPAEVERLKRQVARERPESRTAREVVGHMALEPEVPLSVIATICENWSRELPGHPLPYLHLGRARVERGEDLTRALDDIDRSLDLILRGELRVYGNVAGKDDRWALPLAYRLRARVLLAQGRLIEALASAKAARDIAPETSDQVEAAKIEGEILERLGRQTEARARHELSGDTGAKTAPEFRIKTVDGAEYDLEALSGKVVVINFWFISCLPCVVEIPALNRLVEEFRDRDVVFLAPALDEDPDLVRTFLSKKPFDYRIAADTAPVHKQFGVAVYPTHVILDREGRIAAFLEGGDAKEDERLRPIIERLLAR